MPNMYRNQSRTNEHSKKTNLNAINTQAYFLCVYFVLMEKDTNSSQQQMKKQEKKKMPNFILEYGTY